MLPTPSRTGGKQKTTQLDNNHMTETFQTRVRYSSGPPSDLSINISNSLRFGEQLKKHKQK